MNRFIFFFRGVKSTAEDLELWADWTKDLQKKGKLIDGAPLIRDGLIVSDNGEKVGPFTFNQDHSASGFMIVQADNLDEAVVLSKNCPIFKAGGNITIRPLIENY